MRRAPSGRYDEIGTPQRVLLFVVHNDEKRCARRTVRFFHDGESHTPNIASCIYRNAAGGSIIIIVIYLGLCVLIASMGAYRGLRFLTLFVVSLLLTPLVGVIMLLSTSPAYRRTNGVCKACEQPDHNPVCTVCKRVLVTPIAE